MKILLSIILSSIIILDAWAQSQDVNGDLNISNASGQDRNIRMSTNSGDQKRVLVRQYSTNDVYLGDIDASGGKLHLRANGNTGMSILSSGHVGIGTSSPLSQLDIRSNNHQLRLTDADDLDKSWTVSSIGHNSGIGFFEDASVGRLVISSGGNVGIGSTDPQRALVIENPDNAGNTVISIVSGSTTSGSYLDFSDQPGGGAMNGGRIHYNHANNQFLFGTNSTQGQFIIDDNGDLQAAGTLNLLNENTLGDIISLYGNRLGSHEMYGFGVEPSTLYYKSGLVHRWYIGTNADNGSSAIMELADETLKVDGKILTEEVRVEVINGPDYVFESDYELRSLKETKKYIEENKHLPEIPSAKEMEKDGIGIGDMNMRLLKKIEELTLYQIELLEQLESQSKRLAEVEKELKSFKQ